MRLQMPHRGISNCRELFIEETMRDFAPADRSRRAAHPLGSTERDESLYGGGDGCEVAWRVRLLFCTCTRAAPRNGLSGDVIRDDVSVVGCGGEEGEVDGGYTDGYALSAWCCGGVGVDNARDVVLCERFAGFDFPVVFDPKARDCGVRAARKGKALFAPGEGGADLDDRVSGGEVFRDVVGAVFNDNF